MFTGHLYRLWPSMAIYGLWYVSSDDLMGNPRVRTLRSVCGPMVGIMCWLFRSPPESRLRVAPTSPWHPPLLSVSPRRVMVRHPSTSVDRRGVDKQRGMIEWIDCDTPPATCHRHDCLLGGPHMGHVRPHDCPGQSFIVLASTVKPLDHDVTQNAKSVR